MKKLLLLLGASLILSSCGNDEKEKQKKIDNIKEKEAKLYSDIKSFDSRKAEAAVDAYLSFAEEYPEDKNTPEFRFKAGELLISLQKYTEAAQQFQIIENDHSSYEKAPYALFLQGYIQDNYKGDDEKAKAAYERFLKKYPNHQLADDAKLSIANLGKTDEELIREFEKKKDAQGV